VTTLLIDNYDSFTFNLVQLLTGMGEPTLVLKNDDLDGWRALDWDAIERIVVSPGPGSPSVLEDLGLSRDAILSRAKPLLGVCLGHQALCHLSGGTVRRAPEPVHGRTSRIRHGQDDLFAGVPNGFLATRYHSLVVTDVPDEIERTAWSDDGLLMAVRHRDWPAWGSSSTPSPSGVSTARACLGTSWRCRARPPL
jgi:para-aminobenzoate synthetase